MPNYQNGRIYQLTVDEDESLVYYGSTTQPLSKRLSEHQSKFLKKDHNRTASELFKVGSPIITLIEKYPCDSKEELKARERYYIENNPCVNKEIPGRTKAEYYQDNKERIQKYQEEHKEERAVYMDEWREKNKEHVAEYAKEYQEKNREILRERAKESAKAHPETRKAWVEANKDKRNEQQRVRRAEQHAEHTCDCGGRYTTTNKSSHIKSEKHKKWLVASRENERFSFNQV